MKPLLSAMPEQSIYGSNWRLLAECRYMDPELFFPASPPSGSRQQTTANAQAKAKAKEICARCPVSSECLAFALRTRQEYGIWGGLTQEERV